MKMVIDYKGVKREIDGDFSICIDRAAAHLLVSKILYACAIGKNESLEDIIKSIGWTWTFGWVEIHDPLPSKPNISPLNWQEKA